MKLFTVKTLLDAIRENGLEQAYGHFFETINGYGFNESSSIKSMSTRKIGAACAMGQGAINLGVKNPDTWEQKGAVEDLFGRITDLNDSRWKTFDEIADIIEREYPELLNKVITAPEFDYTPYLNKEPVA